MELGVLLARAGHLRMAGIPAVGRIAGRTRSPRAHGAVHDLRERLPTK